MEKSKHNWVIVSNDPFLAKCTNCNYSWVEYGDIIFENYTETGKMVNITCEEMTIKKLLE